MTWPNFDNQLRNNLQRVIAWSKVAGFFSNDWTYESLLRFHATQRTKVIAADGAIWREMERLVGRVEQMDRNEFARRYTDLHFRAMSQTQSRSAS